MVRSIGPHRSCRWPASSPAPASVPRLSPRRWPNVTSAWVGANTPTERTVSGTMTGLQPSCWSNGGDARSQIDECGAERRFSGPGVLGVRVWTAGSGARVCCPPGCDRAPVMHPAVTGPAGPACSEERYAIRIVFFLYYKKGLSDALIVDFCVHLC